MAVLCQYCGKNLTRRYYLKHHIRNFHMDELNALSPMAGSSGMKQSAEIVQPLWQEGGGKLRKDIFSKEESGSESNDAESDASDMKSNDSEARQVILKKKILILMMLPMKKIQIGYLTI